VAIGRSIVRDPTAFLFDEPLSNLDAALRVEMRYEIAKLHKSLGRTMIYVTHDQVEAMTLADRIVVLEFGRIAQVGTPRELYENPANLFVAEFIGSPKMNIVDIGGAGLRLPFRQGAAKVGIRPEHLLVGSEGQGIMDGTVDVMEYLGADSHLIVDAGELGQITVRTDGDTSIREGDRIGLIAPDDRLRFFAGDGQAI
jgi:multiple sugar transport system ATP-binding protein